MPHAKIAPASAGKPTRAEFQAALHGKDAKISALAAIANALGVPLWMLLLPDVPPRFWELPGRQRELEELVSEHVNDLRDV